MTNLEELVLKRDKARVACELAFIHANRFAFVHGLSGTVDLPLRIKRGYLSTFFGNNHK